MATAISYPDLPQPWNGLLSRLEATIFKYWANRKYSNHIRLQSPEVWKNFTNVLRQLVPLVLTEPLSPAELFFLHATPWLIEIGWQHPEIRILSIKDKYLNAGRIIRLSTSGKENWGLERWDPVTVEFLSDLISMYPINRSGDATTDYRPCGYNQTARLGLIRNLLWLADTLCYSNRVNLAFIKQIRSFERFEMDDVRFAIFPYVSFVGVESNLLNLYFTVNPQDEQYLEKLINLFMFPIIRWFEMVGESMRTTLGFALQFTTPKFELLSLKKTLDETCPALYPVFNSYDALREPANFYSPVTSLAMKNDLYGSKVVASKNDFVDFELCVTKTGEAIATSPVTDDSVTADIGTNIGVEIEVAKQLIAENARNAELLIGFGKMLYDKFFPGEINNFFQRTLAYSKAVGGKKIRIRFRIEPEQLSSLPLEFINSSNTDFWSTNRNFAVSRYLNLGEPRINLPPVKHLSLLLIISNPIENLEIDPDEWLTTINEALSLGSNKIKLNGVVEKATLSNIKKALSESRPNILQFIGHGRYREQRGYLSLIADDFSEELIDDESLSNILQGYSDHLGLICLASCQSAQSQSPQAFNGMAPRLIKSGIPAVIAMQYDLRVSVAKTFLKNFYVALAKGYPVDYATNYARSEVFATYKARTRDFATPVVYMRAQDGKIWEFDDPN